MDIEIKYIKRYGSRNHIWNIDGKDVNLVNINNEMYYYLLDLTKTIKELLNFKKEFIDLYKKESFYNLVRLSFIVWPNLSREYYYHFAKKLIEERVNISKTRLIERVFGHVSGIKFELLPISFSNVLNEIVNNKKFKLQCQDGDIAYIKNKGVRNHLWNIYGNEIWLRDISFKDYERLKNMIYQIKENLVNKIRFADLCKKEHFYNIALLSSVIWPELTNIYLLYFANKLTKNKKIISKYALAYSVFEVDYTDKNVPKEMDVILNNIVTREYEKQKLLFLEYNKKVSINQDIWEFYWLKGGSIRKTVLDFTNINKSNIRRETKHYFFNKLKFCSNYDNLRSELAHLKNGLIYIINKYNYVEFCADFTYEMIKSLKIFLETEARIKIKNKKFAVGSISKVISNCSNLIDYIIDFSDEIKTIKPKTNYFKQIIFHNRDNMCEKTEYIPEEVIEQLLHYIDELNEDYQKILLIMLNCGLRFKEVAYLDENCLDESKENEYILKYIPWKVINSRRKRGLEDYHRIIIKEHIYKEILDQIEKTKTYRQKLNIKQIFINNVGGYKYCIYQAGYFNKAINKLIKKYNITTLNGMLWKYNSRQCRKTLAVDMITNGVQPMQVSNYLAHLSEYTTNKYYNEVRKMKLSELNHEFFSKKFNVIISKEQLSKFDEEERKILYEEFCLSYREVELGKCIKHDSEGKCDKRNGRINCATCKYLCTGPQNLPKWEKMRDSEKKRLQEIVEIYKKEGITDYHNYRNYQRIKYHLDIYQNVIDKILEEVIEKDEL